METTFYLRKGQIKQAQYVRQFLREKFTDCK